MKLSEKDISGMGREQLIARVLHLQDELDRSDDELAPLRRRMAAGRAKYPKGCTVLSLADEAGEAVHSVNKGEPVERVRDELLDTAGVAMRLYLGEVDTQTVVEGLVQRERCAWCFARDAEVMYLAERVCKQCARCDEEAATEDARP